MRPFLAIALLAVVLAGLTAWLHPAMPGYAAGRIEAGGKTPAQIEADTAPILWVDARTTSEYAAGHISGSLHLSEERFDSELPALLERWEPGQKIVVYCGGGTCSSARSVQQRLQEALGPEASVHHLHGGYPAWLAATAKGRP